MKNSKQFFQVYLKKEYANAEVLRVKVTPYARVQYIIVKVSLKCQSVTLPHELVKKWVLVYKIAGPSLIC